MYILVLMRKMLPGYHILLSFIIITFVAIFYDEFLYKGVSMFTQSKVSTRYNQVFTIEFSVHH